MSKTNPFDYVKAINSKTSVQDLSGYNPYLTNRCFAMHLDTIMLAEEMNKAHETPPECQYAFYYGTVRKGKRFGFPPKPPESADVELVMKFYGYSRAKAEEVMSLLTADALQAMRKSFDTGGR